MLVQEPANLVGDFLAVGFERKVASVVEINVDVLEVLLVGVRTGLGKDVVVLAVDDQSGADACGSTPETSDRAARCLARYLIRTATPYGSSREALLLLQNADQVDIADHADAVRGAVGDNVRGE